MNVDVVKRGLDNYHVINTDTNEQIKAFEDEFEAYTYLEGLEKGLKLSNSNKLTKEV